MSPAPDRHFTEPASRGPFLAGGYVRPCGSIAGRVSVTSAWWENIYTKMADKSGLSSRPEDVAPHHGNAGGKVFFLQTRNVCRRRSFAILPIVYDDRNVAQKTRLATVKVPIRVKPTKSYHSATKPRNLAFIVQKTCGIDIN